MEFTWDPKKDGRNRRFHDGIGFEAASDVFFDNLHIVCLDRHEDGEARWQAIGLVDGKLLVVVHTILDEYVPVIRIIPARQATSYERRQYENG